MTGIVSSWTSRIAGALLGLAIVGIGACGDDDATGGAAPGTPSSDATSASGEAARDPSTHATPDPGGSSGSPPAASPVEAGETSGGGAPRAIPDAVLGEVARHTNLGVAWMEQYSYKKGVDEFRAASERAPLWADGHVNLALALYFDQVAEEALERVDQALALRPDHVRAHYVRGLVFDLLGRSEEAATEFGRVSELDPADSWAAYNRGKALLAVDRLDEAVAALEAARSLEPTNQSVHYNLYNAYRRLGRGDDAKAAMQAFRDLKERDVGSLAGNQYGDQGRYALARAAVWDVVREGFRTPDTAPRWTDATGQMLSIAAIENGAAQEGASAGSGGGTDVGGGERMWLPRWVAEGRRSPALGFLHRGPGGPPPTLRELDETSATAVAAGYGPGVSVGDLDGDGHVDLLFANGAADGGPAPNAFLRGTADGRFQDATDATGLGDPGATAATLLGDLDDDGDSDVLVLNADGVRLYRNEGTGSFVDASEALGDAATQTVLSGALGDADHDGDLDLVACDPFGGAVHLFQNANDAGFSRLVDPPAGATRPVVAVFTDLDEDRDVDFLVADAAGPARFLRNDREGRWSEAGAASNIALLEGAACLAVGDPNRDGAMDVFAGGPEGRAFLGVNDGRGRLRPAPSQKTVAATGKGFSILAAQFADWDLDGSEDLVLFPAEGLPRLLRNRGDGELEDRSSSLAVEGVDPSGLRGGVAADLDGDGDLELVLVRNGGGPTILRAEVEGAHWLEVDPVGTNSNRDGVGVRLSLHAGPLTQKVEVRGGGGSLFQTPAAVHFGLGERTSVDALRLLWPGGVLQAEMDVSADQVLAVKELDRKGSSCPVLFAWDGDRWRFVTDFLGVGGIGFLAAPPSTYGSPDPQERVLVEGGLEPLDGLWTLKILENLEEVTYLDAADLLVVDHAEGTEIYPRERFAAGGPLADGRILEIDAGAKHRPLEARDESGTDWTDTVLRRDRRHVEGFEELRYPGFAEPHGLVLDFGALPSGRDWTLFLYGWVDYEYSSSNLAATQAGVRLQPCSIWIPDGAGGWEVAVENAGFPAGLPRMMVHALGDLPERAGGRLLLRTNMQVYWDEIFLAEARDVPPSRITRLEPSRATLRRVGYPRVYRPDGHEPELYDYGLLDPWYPWKVLSGDYTRLGEVTPLLGDVDDRFVIMARGEEVEVAYDPAGAPDVAAGGVRTFVLDAHGYCKDMDPNGAYPDTVEPLPFHAMSAYPYGPDESYPTTEDHQAYRRGWNTRRIWGR